MDVYLIDIKKLVIAYDILTNGFIKQLRIKHRY